MSAIPGTNLAAPVVPFTTDDIYPTHKALYGHGGWRSVPTLADRDALPADRLEEGSVVWVADELAAFIYLNEAWEDFQGIMVPEAALTETVSCFFPDSAPKGSKLIWTAAVDVNFGPALQVKVNIITNPADKVIVSIFDATNVEVAQIIVLSTGTVLTRYTSTDPAYELKVATGSYLKFVISDSDIASQDLSFTLAGKRVKLTAN